MNKTILHIPFAFLVSALLAACGGGGGGSDDGGGGNNPPPTGRTVAGSAYKGPLANADVTLYALQADGSNGAALGTGTTDDGGTFGISDVDNSYTGCIVALATGGTFKDEGTGETVALADGETLGAATCDTDDVASLAITPLTNAALARARRLAADGVALATAVDSSSASVAQQWGLADISAPPLDPLEEQPAAGDVTARIAQLGRMQYGLVIAGLSAVAADNGVPVMAFVAGIATDAADGLLDGTDDGAQIMLPAANGGEVPLSAQQQLADVQAHMDPLLAAVPAANGLDAVFVPPTAVPLGNDGSNALAIATPSIPAFVDASSGSFTLTASGGTPPYQWTLLSGSLPEGLTLNTDGTISGTATLAPGSSMSIGGPVVIQVQDAAGATAVFPFAVTVVSGPPSVTGDAAPTGYVGVPFSTLYSATGGAPPYAFTLASGTGFPPLGVFLNAGGDLSGTPSAAGTSAFGVCATDLVGATDCMDVTMTVEEAPQAAGFWSGTYSRTGPGDGGCIYQSAGTLQFDITSTDNVNYSGDSYIDGIMLRYIPSCDFAFYTSNIGSAALTVGTDGSVTGTVTVAVVETGRDYTLHLSGRLAGDTISGDILNGAGDGIEGSFEVTRQ